MPLIDGVRTSCDALTSSDFSRIYQTVEDFFSGLISRNLELLMRTWHPEARICYVHNGHLSSTSFSMLEDYCQQQNRVSEILDWRIIHFESSGFIAIVKVMVCVEYSQSTTMYLDYLTLMKFPNEKWFIVNKAFHSLRILEGLD
ncbi:MAG: nuclear transport factor 2 family protein [Candidatus Hodarchaeota archaeon]